MIYLAATMCQSVEFWRFRVNTRSLPLHSLVASTSQWESECLVLAPSLPLASSVILGMLLNFPISFLTYKIE